MPKLRLLLLDAVVVIYLHELGLWEEVIAQCDVHLSREVVGEAHFFLDANGDRRSIDLNQYERSRQITVHDVTLADTAPLRSLFGRDMLEKMDPGETELLAVLHNSFDEYKLCSADRIVYRALGALRRSDQGISLEEVLRMVGLTRPVAPPYTKGFREQFSRKGFEEGITGLASL